jgi:hypothetical protein
MPTPSITLQHRYSDHQPEPGHSEDVLIPNGLIPSDLTPSSLSSSSAVVVPLRGATVRNLIPSGVVLTCFIRSGPSQLCTVEHHASKEIRKKYSSHD